MAEKSDFARRHMCVGPSCWECGEPTELRHMRHDIAKALIERKEDVGLEFSKAHKAARIATETIRGDILNMMQKIGELQDELHFARNPKGENV